MPEPERRYDESTETYWIYYDFRDAETLVPNDELRDWISALKEGETEDGESVEAVNYVFSDEQAAEYNFQALAYAGIGTYVGDLDDYEQYKSPEEAPDFDTEEDFGIE